MKFKNNLDFITKKNMNVSENSSLYYGDNM